jgi:hypothetical protein
MESIRLELPQLVLVSNGTNRYKYLERLGNDSNEPLSHLTFQEDSKGDSRIITIKYNVESEKDSYVLYYSEAFNNHNNYTILTGNLGYGYIGRVLLIDKNDHKIGVGFEHLPRERLRLNHIDRITERDYERGDLIGNLRTDYVAKKYEEMFYRLVKFS